MRKVEIVREIVQAMRAFEREESEANADRVIAALDAFILAPEEVTAPEPMAAPEPPRDVYGWMRIEG